jgi:hypothetical protein
MTAFHRRETTFPDTSPQSCAGLFATNGQLNGRKFLAMPIHSERSTSDILEHAEAVVGPALEQEFKGYFLLVREITDLAGDLIEHVQDAPGDPKALHASAILLSRIVTDLQACSLLIRRGYAASALSLTSGMLEMAHTSMYIGADESRATQWFTHADTRTASPWTLREMVKSVANAMGVPEDAAKREYDEIYRQINMAKHGNPMALGESGLVHRDGTTFILAVPHLGESIRRWSHAALHFAFRYTALTAITFLRDHLRTGANAPAYRVKLMELTEREKTLRHDDASDLLGDSSDHEP